MGLVALLKVMHRVWRLGQLIGIKQFVSNGVVVNNTAGVIL